MEKLENKFKCDGQKFFKTGEVDVGRAFPFEPHVVNRVRVVENFFCFLFCPDPSKCPEAGVSCHEIIEDACALSFNYERVKGGPSNHIRPVWHKGRIFKPQIPY
jgi:Pyruvate/2-oxoacid:ferredoxin oxidoreductase delta subunit